MENCEVSYCRDAGIQISAGGSYNYLHNCDCFSNYDSLSSGGNADGFAIKLEPGPGNVLRGCRSWNNSDDGYDLFENSYKVVFDSCWAWHNGYAYVNGKFVTNNSMNGNGFKVGGNYYIGHHRLTNCVAFGNKSKGFDQNNNNGGVTVINCTGYNNGYYNFSFPNDTVYIKDNLGNIVQTYYKEGNDTMINNVSYKSPGVRFTKYHTTQTTNSWNIYTVSANDFISIDTSLAATLRSANGSIPVSGFLRLNTGSASIDAGTPVNGIPFVGSAPDLGAFETSTENTSQQSFVLNRTVNYNKVYLNWSVVNEVANSGWVLQKATQVNDNTISDWKDLFTLNSLGVGINTLHAYDTIDVLNEFGKFYYRVKQTDVSNVVRLSNVVDVSIPDTLPISVYPCPFQTQFTIEFNLSTPKIITASLYSSKGQFIADIINYFYQKGIYHVKYLNGSNLATGVYYLKFLADDGTRKIIPLLKKN